MSRESLDVFVSYRRSTGKDLAQLVYTSLTAKGLRVFLDVRDLPAGPFDASLASRISEARDFVLILTPHSLDRLGEPGDWLTIEIERAFETARNIVPFVTPDFVAPAADTLQPHLRELYRYQQFPYNHEFSDQSIDRLFDALTPSKPRASRRLRLAASVVALLLVCLIAWVWAWRPPAPADARVDARLAVAVGSALAMAGQSTKAPGAPIFEVSLQRLQVPPRVAQDLYREYRQLDDAGRVRPLDYDAFQERKARLLDKIGVQLDVLRGTGQQSYVRFGHDLCQLLLLLRNWTALESQPNLSDTAATALTALKRRTPGAHLPFAHEKAIQALQPTDLLDPAHRRAALDALERVLDLFDQQPR